MVTNMIRVVAEKERERENEFKLPAPHAQKLN